MLKRLGRIKREFGTQALGRTLLLLIGLVGLSVFGVLGLQTPWPAVVTGVGLVIGWVLRATIVAHAERIFWVMPAALFIYGIVLFLGDRVLSMSGETQLLIITVTTVLLFDAQFWSLSEPDIVSTDSERLD